MLVIISYDIENDKTRTKLANQLKNFGPRIQKSVFEADIKATELEKLKDVLADVKLKENDRIRLYRLCKECKDKIKLWGKGEITEDKGYYIY